jgi:hypothetical protein
MFAVKSGPTGTKKPTIDHEIEQLEQTSSSDTVHVLVQTSGDIKVLAAELRTKGIKVRRPLLESGTFAIDISANDLLWLEGLDGVDAISLDAPVYSAPLSSEPLLSSESLLSNGGLRPRYACSISFKLSAVCR